MAGNQTDLLTERQGVHFLTSDQASRSLEQRTNKLKANVLSGKALAAGQPNTRLSNSIENKTMDDPDNYFITWTTYGTWMPGDHRGWRKTGEGNLIGRPNLEKWCRDQMAEDSIVLTISQRESVKNVCEKHAKIRNWILHAIAVRSNHIHLVVTSSASPKTTRDQFKANATKAIRDIDTAFKIKKIWTKGGDCELVDSEELPRVIQYVLEAQENAGAGK